MLRRIILENFMSHGRTEIDLADGLTVLTGPNNCGKSAVVAALQILAANGRSTHVIRHGEKFCRITVETDDGHTICWERKKKTVKYTIDGEDIHRVGTSIPESLHEVLRLDRVEAKVGKATHEYDIHFGEQKSPVFLIGESGSRAASFFASSSDASRLVEMQHRHRSKLTSQRSEAKRLNKELQTNTTRLACLAPLDQISDRISTADATQKTLDESQQRIQRLTDIVRQLNRRSAETNDLRRQWETLGRLGTATTTPTELQHSRQARTQFADLIDELGHLQHQEHCYRISAAGLKPLQTVPTQHVTARIRNLIELLHQATRRKETSSAVLACCEPIKAPPAPEPADACRQRLKQLKEATIERDRLVKLNAVIVRLTVVPAISATQRLRTLIRNLTTGRHGTQKTRAVSAAVSPLHEPPSQSNSSRLKQLIGELNRHHRLAADVKSGAETLQKIQAPIEHSDVTPLADIIQKLTELQEVVDRTCKHFDECLRQVSESEMQIREFVESHPRCSTCGAEIDPETLMAGVPVGHDHTADVAADNQGTFRRKG